MSRDKQSLEEIKSYDDSYWLRYLAENTIFDTENIRGQKEWLIKQLEAERERAANLIADQLFAFINKDAGCPHDFEIKAFEEATLYLQEHDQSSKYNPDLFKVHLQQMKEVIGNE
ncbi:hypothetical protein GTY77_18175 [Streptomyces sp. SID8380]|nr:hypothetical protein [Streptomyces sp. SID8380]